MSLRARLVAIQALVLAAGLAAFGLLLAARLEAALLGEVDESLELRATAVAAQVRGAPRTGADLTAAHVEPGPLEELAHPGIYVQVRGPDGRVLASSANLAGADLPAPHAAHRPETLAVPGAERLRVLEAPVEQDGRAIALVRVAESLRLVDASLRQLAGLMLVVGTGVLAGSVALTWLAAGRALAPLARITAAAEAIATAGGSARQVPGVERRDEVGRLARALTETGGRLWRLLEAQRQLLADTSHELRNPLTVIRTNLGLLRKELPPDVREDIADETEDEAVRMSRLVDDLLLLGEVQERAARAPTPVRLDRLAREVVQRYTSRGERRIRMEADDALAVRADAERLRQVLVNLLDNAVRHTPPNGRIRVCVRRRGSEAELEVADSGPGIPPEHLPRLFDRFYRVEAARDRQSGGSGLGLAIVKHLAETYGGRVRAESPPGQGARFVVTFPVEPSWSVEG